MLRRIAAAVTLLAVGVAVWLAWRTPGVAAPHDAQPRRGEAEMVRASAALDARSGEDPLREPAPAPAPTTARPLLHVRLRGLHPQVPWTAPLQIEWNDRGEPRHDDVHLEQPVDEHGRCAFAPPEWWTAERDVKLRVAGRCDGYLDLHHRAKGRLDLAAELVLDVHAFGLVQGRVTDLRGAPQKDVRLVALAVGDDGLSEPFYSHAGTDEHGRYSLRAPPELPLVVFALPMGPNKMRWRSMDGVDDDGVLRDDALPAWRRLRADVRQPRVDVDFVLPDATRITGHVRELDGAPVASAGVCVDAPDGARHRVSHSTEVIWRGDRPPLFSATCVTELFGEFSLPAPAGEPLDVYVRFTADLRHCGAPPRHRVRAPQQLDLTLPRRAVLQATIDGEVARHARIHIEGEDGYTTNADGNAHVLIHAPTRVRAERGEQRSEWVTVVPQQQGQTILLPLRDAR